MDIELEQFSTDLYSIKVDLPVSERLLNRSSVKNLLRIGPDDYRTIFKEPHIFRSIRGQDDDVYGDIRPGVSWGTARLRQTAPATVEENLEQLGEAVLAGEVEPPFDKTDRATVLDPEDRYDTPEAFRSTYYTEKHDSMTVDEDEEALTITAFGGASTTYRFTILDKPGEDGNGTLLHRETEDHTRSGATRYTTDSPTEPVTDLLDEMGYQTVLETDRSSTELEQAAALRQLDTTGLEDASQLEDLLYSDS